MGKQNKDPQEGRAGTRRSRRLQQYTSDAADYGSKELEHELATQGLYIKEITGDGNCLFRSLSDQMGESDKHREIRHEVVTYLREHEEEFRVFIEEDYQKYVERMSNNGVYGGNVELVAFARAYQKHLKIYQPGLSYIIKSSETDHEEKSSEMLHIVYHSFEHYSSVRMKDGPHEGKPGICPTRTAVPAKTERAESAPPSDLEKICLSSVTGTDLSEVRETMKQCKGNVNAAIELLLEKHTGLESEIDGTEQDARTEAPDHCASLLLAEMDVLGTDASQIDQIESISGMTTKSPPEKSTVRKSRIAARDRKDIAKRAQKERRRTEKRTSTKMIGKDEEVESRMKTIHI